METNEETQINVSECPYCKRKYPVVQLKTGEHVLVQPVPVRGIYPMVPDTPPAIVSAVGQPLGQSRIDLGRALMGAVTGEFRCDATAPMYIEHGLVCTAFARSEKLPAPQLLMDKQQLDKQQTKRRLTVAN